MPSFEREYRSNQRESEPSFHRDMDEHSSYVLQKFIEAGFDESDLPLSSPESREVSRNLHEEHSLTTGALIFLKRSLTNKDVRQAFANGLFLESSGSNADAVMNEVDRLSLKTDRESGTTLAFSDLIKGLEKESGVNIDSGKSYAHFAWLGARILQSDSLFNLFDGSGMKLAEFLGKYFSGHEFYSLRGIVDDILTQECRFDEGRGKKLFDGQDESFLLELADHTKQLDWGELLPKDPEEKMSP